MERVAGCDQRGAHLVAVMSALPAKWPTCARKCTLGAGREANTPFLLHSSCSLCKKAMQPMPSPPQISLTLSPSLSFCPFENAPGSLELISQPGPVQIRERDIPPLREGVAERMDDGQMSRGRAVRTGVQDGRVPSKSAQMSMPQNPMKFELEVPGML